MGSFVMRKRVIFFLSLIMISCLCSAFFVSSFNLKVKADGATTTFQWDGTAWFLAKTKVDKMPSENVFLDANGTDVWLTGQLAAVDDNTKYDGWWGFLPGSEDNVKVSYTSNPVPDGETVTVNLAKKYKASNFSVVRVKMLVGAAQNVTNTAYATTDTGFTTSAGTLVTSNDTEVGILEINASKIADAEGYIDTFVIKRTGSDGQLFFDYVELVLDQKDDTAYTAPVILPIDGNAVIMSPGNYVKDTWGVLGDDKEKTVATTGNVGNNTIIKFMFATKYKAANFMFVSVNIGATNWTENNTITTTMYALSDSEFKNPLDSASNPTLTFGRATLHGDSTALADDDGYIAGFYLVKTQSNAADPKWELYAGNVSLVPTDLLSDSKYIATGYFGDGIADENEHWTTKLTCVNGWTDKDGKFEPAITVEADDEAMNGYVFRVGFHSWFHTIATNAIIFKRPVSAEEAKAGLIIRIKAHLSPNGATYSTVLGGIRFYSLDSNGNMGQGYMLPEAITQDEFVLLSLSGEEAAALANADGNIYGIQIGSAIQRGNGTDDFYIGEGDAYIEIDYIELRKNVTVTYYNATETGETQTMTTGSGFGSETIYMNPADGKTKKFFGWVSGKDASAISIENLYDFSQALDGDVNLYGWWIDVAIGSDYYGVYRTADGKTVKVYAEGVELGGYADYEKAILSADGKIYVKRESGSEILNIADTSLFTKSEIVEITFNAFGKEIAKKAMAVGDAIDYTFAPDGYSFKKWISADGTETTIASKNVLSLYAVCERVEISADNYAEYLGVYFNRANGEMLELKANNVATITFANGTTKNITYYLLEKGGFAYLDGETEIPCSFNANRVLVSADTEYARLTSYTVTFYVDGAEYATVTVNGGTYKVNAPENDPAVSGYEFVGWYTQVSDGEVYDFSQTVYRNMSLYAQFKPVDKPADNNNSSKKSGCNSSVAGMSGVYALAIVGVAFCIWKKKQVKD